MWDNGARYPPIARGARAQRPQPPESEHFVSWRRSGSNWPRMRTGIAILACFGLLACSPRRVEVVSDVAPSGVAASALAPSAPAPLPSAPAVDALDLSCDNPLYAFAARGATLDDLRNALGESKVRPQSYYDETWVLLYPGDPARELVLDMDPERVFAVEARTPTSAARLGNVLRVGDDLAAVERFNGGALPLGGPEPQAFEVASRIDATCRYFVELRADTDDSARASGATSSGHSARAPGLRVSALRMSRRGWLE